MFVFEGHVVPGGDKEVGLRQSITKKGRDKEAPGFSLQNTSTRHHRHRLGCGTFPRHRVPRAQKSEMSGLKIILRASTQEARDEQHLGVLAPFLVIYSRRRGGWPLGHQNKIV